MIARSVPAKALPRADSRGAEVRTRVEAEAGTIVIMRANGVRTLAAWCIGRGWRSFSGFRRERLSRRPAGAVIWPEAAVPAVRAPGRRRAVELERDLQARADHASEWRVLHLSVNL
jgi:hypothetical protein